MSDYMQDDVASFLTTWGETLTVFRDEIESYTSGKAVHNWTNKGTITGDLQPISGSLSRMEASMKVKSSAIVISSVDVDVVENDKLQREDGSFMYVNYVRKFEDHWTIYLKKNK